MNPSAKPTTRFGKTLDRIQENKKLQAAKTLEERKLFEAKDNNMSTQEVILKAFSFLVKYLDSPNRVTKTAIVNHMESIKTPDALKVAEAVERLHNTVKDKKDVDLSEIASLLKAVLEQTKKIPKVQTDITIPSPIDNTEQLTSMAEAIKAVDESIKAQKLVAEAPIINVPETVVNVDKTDITPLEKEQKKTRLELIKALKGIVIPETNLKPTEKELKKLNKLFNEFLNNMPLGGSSGGGVAYVGPDGNYAPVQQETDGSVPVTIKNPEDIGGGTADPFAAYKDARIDVSGDPMYFGYEDPSGNWYIKRINFTTNTTMYYQGAGGISSNWAGRAGYTYLEYNQL